MKKAGALLGFISLMLASVVTLAAPAQAAPSTIADSVQVDLNCGTSASPVTCTGSSIMQSNTSRNLAVGSDGTVFALFYGDQGIRVTKSTDKGLTWAVSSQVSDDKAEAEIAISNTDILYVAWNTDGKYYFSRSVDLGDSWESPKEIGSGAGTLHMAVDGEYVYAVSRNSQKFLYSSDFGNSFDELTNAFPKPSNPNLTAWAYSDVLVDPLTNKVYVFVDDPNVVFYESSDRGVSFSAGNPVGAAIFYSVAAFGSAVSGSAPVSYMYMAGSDSTGSRVEVSPNLGVTQSVTVTSLTAGGDRGRFISSDFIGNVTFGAGVNNVGNGERGITMQISNDSGDNFATTLTVTSSASITSATSLSATSQIDRGNGDLLVLFQVGDSIYFSSYSGYLTGYDASFNLSSITLGAPNEVKTMIVENAGNTTLNFTTIGLRDGDFTIDGSSTCSTSSGLAAGATCSVVITGATAAEDLLEISTSTLTRFIPVSLGSLAASGQTAQAVVASGATAAVVDPVIAPYAGPRLQPGVLRAVVPGSTLAMSGKGLPDVSRVSANGVQLNFSFNDLGELSVSIPSNFALGTFDLVFDTKTYGEHMIQGGLVVKASLVEDFYFHMKSGWVDAEAQAAIKAFAAGKAGIAKKIHCMVNGPARAADLALSACDVIKQAEPTAAEMVTSTRNTYSKTGVWLKIWISY